MPVPVYKPQYLQRLRSSRGQRKVGEVFAMKLKGVGYIFGRVIRNDCDTLGCAFDTGLGGYRPPPWRRTPGDLLVYIYKGESDRLDRVPPLHARSLLVPPAIIRRTGWTAGYFQPVRWDELLADDIRPVHCFWQDGPLVNGRSRVEYLDEYGRPLAKRINPCRLFAVGDHGTIERDVAHALGLQYAEWWVTDGSDRGRSRRQQ